YVREWVLSMDEQADLTLEWERDTLLASNNTSTLALARARRVVLCTSKLLLFKSTHAIVLRKIWRLSSGCWMRLPEWGYNSPVCRSSGPILAPMLVSTRPHRRCLAP